MQAAAHSSPWTLLIGQFRNVLVIILLVATALSTFLGYGVEAIVIAIIVLFSVTSGFVQKYRADRAIEQNGYVATGPAIFARYDPPLTLWFMRRNELLIPVERASQTGIA